MASHATRAIFSVFSFALCFIFLASLVTAVNTFNSPSSCIGQWTTCANAFANNVNVATAGVSASANKSGNWNGYNFSIPGSSQINSVIVRADFSASKTSGKIAIRVSGDGGTTWGQAHVVGGNTAEQTFIIDVTGDLAWTPTKLNNGNFKVNATCFKQGGGSNPTCRLDWVPVNVTYTPFDFSVSASPSSGSAAQGRSANTNVSITLLAGVSQQVNLSQIGCPSGATCTFNPSSGNPSYTSTFTATAGITTPVGTYPITLIGSGDGKTRNTTYTFIVTDSQPTANPSANPTFGVAPLSVNFTGLVVGGDAPLSYLWDFKDGTNSTQQNPQHTFTTPRVYNVSFTVTDFDGDSSTGNVLITVNDFSVSASPQSGSVVQARSVNTTVTVTLLGGVSEKVNLSQIGCPSGATCTFNPSSGNPTYSSTLTISTSGLTPAGNYLITIIGTGYGTTRSATYNLTITDSQPVATSSANPTSGIEPLTVQFNCSASGGDAPLSYFWNFKDGTNSTQQNPQHTYNTGTFNASCTVTDFDGDSSISAVVIVVDADSQPAANPSANPSSGTAPLIVNFTGDFTGGNSPFTYFWNFKDGTNSTQQNPQHTFVGSGTYNISFKVTDIDGDSSTGYVLVTVNEACARTNPSVNLIPQIQSGTANTTLLYTVNVTNNDNAPCGISTFDLGSIIPGNWTGIFAQNPLVISPGWSATTIFSLTSDLNASPRVYAFNVSATNLNATSFKRSVTGYYNVTI